MPEPGFVDRPRWQHSDGRPYDDLDFGRTRFVDDADLFPAPGRGGSAPRRFVSALARLVSFRHRKGTDTSQLPT